MCAFKALANLRRITSLTSILDKCARTSLSTATPSESLMEVLFARMERLPSAMHEPESLLCIHYNGFRFGSPVLILPKHHFGT